MHVRAEYVCLYFVGATHVLVFGCCYRTVAVTDCWLHSKNFICVQCTHTHTHRPSAPMAVCLSFIFQTISYHFSYPFSLSLSRSLRIFRLCLITLSFPHSCACVCVCTYKSMRVCYILYAGYVCVCVAPLQISDSQLFFYFCASA